MMTNGLTSQAVQDRAELLGRAREWLGEGSIEELESVVVYTDNLVHGAPFADPDEATSRLGFSVTAACHYQLELALQGTIMRGGIAIGQHHQTESIVAGPALIEAHHLEANVAVHPRILLSGDAWEIVAAGLAEWAEPAESPWAAQLLVDEDQLFVSYLSASEDYDRGRADQLRVVEQHRDGVAAGLESTKSHGGRPYAKWTWAAAYHNYYVTAEKLPETLRVCTTKGESRNFTSIPDLLVRPRELAPD